MNPNKHVDFQSSDMGNLEEEDSNDDESIDLISLDEVSEKSVSILQEGDVFLICQEHLI